MAEWRARSVTTRRSLITVSSLLVAFSFGLSAATFNSRDVASGEPAVVEHRASPVDLYRTRQPVRTAPRPAIANLPDRPDTPSPMPARANSASERFQGESGGRREVFPFDDLYDERAYLLKTATNLHQRGWIGMESEIGSRKSKVAESGVWKKSASQ